MKSLWLMMPVIFLAFTRETCKDKKTRVPLDSVCYKGKLLVKGGCMNYTIGLLTRNFDTSLVVAKWTDETTGRTYHNVFALNSRCTFPDMLREGDEFYFVIDSTTVQNCNVCLMYYPVPPKKISIKVLPGPCTSQ